MGSILTCFGCATGGPVCFFTFDKLCNANVGAADYIALANKFHTIALSGVPVFTADIRSQAYRYAIDFPSVSAFVSFALEQHLLCDVCILLAQLASVLPLLHMGLKATKLDF